MCDDFQTWLKSQGYFRMNDSRLWYDKNYEIVNGAVLARKLNEWKELTQIQQKNGSDNHNKYNFN